MPARTRSYEVARVRSVPSSTTEPVLTGTNAPANATVQVWEDSTLLGSTRADASGSWRLGLVNALSEGPHNLLARALNDQGQTLGNSALASIVVDTQLAIPAAPRLDPASDTGFSGSDRITGLKTLSWSGTAEAWDDTLRALSTLRARQLHLLAIVFETSGFAPPGTRWRQSTCPVTVTTRHRANR